MNFVQQLEESLRDLAAEARKHHPGVKEASERATWTLRQYKNAYASAVRKANAGNSTAPTTKMFQSSELLHPFLLAANYPNASPELLEISFRAMRLLLEHDAVPPNDAIHLVRVWMIQAQVVATHFQKNSKSNKRISKSSATATSYETKVIGSDLVSSSATSDAVPNSDGRDTESSNADTSSNSGSGSWFFWSSSTPTTTTATKSSEYIGEMTTTNETLQASPGQQPQPAGATLQNVVSSSTGQAGHSSTATSKEMEKLALDILSSLSLLMQVMFRHYPKILGVDTVLWKHSFGVLCLCLSPSMNTNKLGGGSSSGASSSKKHGASSGSSGSGKQSSSIIQQAAHSTLSQILALLYEPITSADTSGDEEGNETLEANEAFVSLRERTWQDLLSLSQAPALASVSSLQGAFALCKTTVPSSTFSGSTFTSKRSAPTPVPVPPPPTMALQVLTKLWRNSEFKLSEKLSTETMEMTASLLRSVQSNSESNSMSSVEASYSVLNWTSLVLAKCGDSNFQEFEEFHDVLKEVINIVAMATESCRRHPDFEDGFVYSQEFASSDATAMSTTRSSMTQSQPQNQQEPQSQQSNAKPLIPSATLGKASLALDVLYRVLTNGKTSIVVMRDPAIVGLVVEALSDFATLAASCEVHMTQLVEFVKSRGGDEGQEQQQQPLPTSFIRKLEQGADNYWESLVESSTLGEAVWTSLSSVVRTLQNVCSPSKPAKKAQVLEIFAPSLAVLQHYLKRFSGNHALVHLALEGYNLLAQLCFPSVDMQRALLTSLCKLSLPAWGKRDHSALLEDHHVEILLCVMRIIHTYHPYISNDWEVVLLTLEELSALAVASPMLSDEAYHSALAVASIYGRAAAFSTCFTPNELIQMVQALCRTIATSLDDPIFLSDTGKSTRVSLEPAGDASSKAEGMSISERLMKAGVSAIYGGSSAESSSKASPAPSNRTRNRYYEDYRSDFLARISKSKNPIRVESLGRVPFVLALLADIAMANSYRYKECGERISGLMSDLAASSASVRPFLMDTVALLTMSHISNSEESPAPFIGPGKLVFDNPMQSQLLAVERAVETETEAASRQTSTADISQTELLGPLCDSLQSAVKADMAEASLETLHSVLETTGSNLSDDAWVIIINALSSLSGDPSIDVGRSSPAWSKCSMDSFRCLKVIVNDFIDDFPANTSAIISLLDCCSSFGSSRHDVNTSLTAIGLLWTIADRDSGTDSINRALSKLVFLASDSRPEVRNASVNTLFSCIAGRGSGFSADRWQECVQGTIFEVYETVSRKARGGDPETAPNTTGNRKSSRYQLSLHHTRDSETKQWVATQVVVLRGLTRVLRTFFGNLLETTDVEAVQPENAKKDDVPWFQDAWVQILDYAYEAAAQGGSRDTLDIRSIGIDLLILCCQLSSKGGIKATSPARVGTNMEVVDGALRSVRESMPSVPPKPPKGNKSHKRSHSMICETARRDFFIEAFESLESYIEFLEKVPKSEMDDTQLQVVHRFCTGLKSLYDGSKRGEFQVENRAMCIECFVENEAEVHVLSGSGQVEEAALEKDFGRHVVTLLAATVSISTVDPAIKYLNQAQRGCLQLLKTMAADGSCDSLRYLVRLGSVFFFIKDVEEVDHGKSESLGLEAVSVLSEALQSATPPQECKCLVLDEVLALFIREGKQGLLANRQKHKFRIDYKRLIPIVTTGVGACISLENQLEETDNTDSPSYRLVENCWASLTEALSIMIVPISMGGDGIVKMSRVAEVMELVKFIVPRVPHRFTPALCETLVVASSSCLEVAELHERCSIKHTDKDVASKSKRHRDELLELFSACFVGCCKLKADSPALKLMSKKTLEGAVNVMFSSGDDGESYAIEASVIICKSVRDTEGVDVLLPAIFPSLCKLISAKDEKVRRTVAETLGAEKTAYFLQNAERRRLDALQSAKLLSEALDEQRAENERLKRSLAVLEASPNL
mmetsp:Transcript_10820/g.29917  ORF Transcript_10820/g.29917 Transcript_10820/m.29917 type:complete len:1956 (+) Transcript_10820:225-6092(+)